MTINLDEIEKALDEITQGEWIFWEEYTEDRGTNYGVKCNGARHWIFPPLNIEKKDVEFIANAPEWLRLLVERVRKLEAFARKVTDENGACETHEAASDMLCELATEADRLLKIKREVVST